MTTTMNVCRLRCLCRMWCAFHRLASQHAAQQTTPCEQSVTRVVILDESHVAPVRPTLQDVSRPHEREATRCASPSAARRCSPLRTPSCAHRRSPNERPDTRVSNTRPVCMRCILHPNQRVTCTRNMAWWIVERCGEGRFVFPSQNSAFGYRIDHICPPLEFIFFSSI